MIPDSEFYDKWEQLLNEVDKLRIPAQFIKKLILKLDGRKQHTINIAKLLKQGLSMDELEEAVAKKLYEYEEQLVDLEFIIDLQAVADEIQPETDKLLRKL